jgi:hypothetical protein
VGSSNVFTLIKKIYINMHHAFSGKWNRLTSGAPKERQRWR